MLGFKILTVFLLSALGGQSVAETVDRQWVGQFSSGRLEQWEPQVFSGETRYQLQSEQTGSDLSVLHALSHASASGLVKHQQVNLTETPILHWRWKVARGVNATNERRKNNDDYAARVYIIVKGGFFPWKTMALNYVWANGVKKGDMWNNAFAPGQSKMLALRSAEAELGQWYEESRNVQRDFQALFGESVTHIDVIAIMTDTDNTGTRAETYYGDIFFSNR
ncbi:hypothetical protein A9Q99_11865 [Gammaproteobacteria bacterium 45_16_T64]|nr:hypothetical protein A9Q99_11865 [Gammaproteobacteria bacterium 45_16_T64]